MPTVNNIASFYLAHKEEIDEGAEDVKNPALALYFQIFKSEAHKQLKGAAPP